MKCSICDSEMDRTWVCVAGMMASGALYVVNLHWNCIDREFGSNYRRWMQRVVTHNGWVQEQLPGFRNTETVRGS